MPYFQIENFSAGMDRRRVSRVAAPNGSAWTIKNAHLSRGGDIEKRRGFAVIANFPSNQHGLFEVNEELFVIRDANATVDVGAGNVAVGYEQILASGDSEFLGTDNINLETQISWINNNVGVMGETLVSNPPGLRYKGFGWRFATPINLSLITFSDTNTVYPPPSSVEVIFSHDGMLWESLQTFALGAAQGRRNHSVVIDQTISAPYWGIGTTETFSNGWWTVGLIVPYQTSTTGADAVTLNRIRQQINVVSISLPGSRRIEEVPSAVGFNGVLYSVVRATDGRMYHYYGENRVTDWDEISRTLGSNDLAAQRIAQAIGAAATIEATADGNVVRATGVTPGVNLGISVVVEGQGQSMTISNIQTATPQTLPVSASYEFRVEGLQNAGSGVPHRIDEIDIGGVELLPEPVVWAGSPDATAANVVTAINTGESVYRAVALRDVINIVAPLTEGATANGRAVTISTTNLNVDPPSGTLTGGVTEIIGRVQITNLTITGTYNINTIFNIRVGQERFTIANAAVGVAEFVQTFRQRVYAPVGSNVYYSRIDNPMDWESSSTGSDAGFINMSAQSAGDDLLVSVVEYQDRLAFLSEQNIFIWNISVNPDNNQFIQSLQSTGTQAARSVVSYGNNDVFYLHFSGIRSIKARDSSNAAFVSDVGTAIDTHVQDYLVTLTESQIRGSVAIIEPRDGRYWLAIGRRVYVFSYFPSSKISAWSYYELGFDITHMTRIRDRIWVRGVDDAGTARLQLYGGYDNNVYTSEEVLLETPYMRGRDPAGFRTYSALDVNLRNVWDIELIDNPNNESVVRDIGTFADVTYNEPRIPLSGYDALVALNIRNTTAGAAFVSQVSLHYESKTEDG